MATSVDGDTARARAFSPTPTRNQLPRARALTRSLDEAHWHAALRERARVRLKLAGVVEEAPVVRAHARVVES